jgi:hypothetical protein
LCPQKDQWLKTSFANRRPVFQRDDGLWSIGWHDDAAGPFPTRLFAESVAIASHCGVLNAVKPDQHSTRVSEATRSWKKL